MLISLIIRISVFFSADFRPTKIRRRIRLLAAAWKLLLKLRSAWQFSSRDSPYYAPPRRGGGIKRSSASVRLSDVAYIGSNSKTKRPRKAKLCTGYPRSHATPTPTSRSKGQKSRSRGGGILWRPPSRTACFVLFVPLCGALWLCAAIISSFMMMTTTMTMIFSYIFFTKKKSKFKTFYHYDHFYFFCYMTQLIEMTISGILAE